MKDKKLKKEKSEGDLSQLKTKIFYHIFVMIVLALFAVSVLYRVVWYRRGADFIVYLFRRYLRLNYDSALTLYQQVFRNWAELIWIIVVIMVFGLILRVAINWYIEYFVLIGRGIDALISDETETNLPIEMLSLERKLNNVRLALKQRSMEAALAEQRKNDLVMYLAHDIRTPLTSVIGHLALMEEIPDMPEDKRQNYVHITLEKAYRLEKMINEFFEITRCNLQQIHISKENVDLYYMLVQLSDEFSSVLSANGNVAILKANENLTVDGDPDKLARVFNNILKNAVTYSMSDTEILIFGEEKN